MKDIDREAPPLDEEPEEGGGRIDGGCIAVLSVFKQMEQT